MTTIYKLTIQDIPGAGYAQYTNGMLQLFINEGWVNLAHGDLPLREPVLLSQSLFKVEHLKPRTVADKVALFCILYKQHKGVAYRAGKAEKANLKLVVVNEHLLNTYFTSTTYPLGSAKSMEDYVRHYNTVRDLDANGKPAKSKFPDVYDREYEKHLDPGVMSEYWKHLRQLGWVKEDGVWINKSNQ